MAKLELNDIAGGYNAPARINANNELIETALENTLSRDGTTPNQMEADFDMNGYRIMNVASPQSPLDVARLVDITSLITLTGAEVPSMVGNADKVLSTDGSILIWSNIPAAALPLFTSSVKGAVGPSGGGTTKTLWADGTWETPAVKNGYTQTAVANVFTAAQSYTFVELTYATSLTLNTALSNQYKVTLTGNPTFSFTNAVNGRKFRLFLIQDGTGSRSVTWPSVTWAAETSPVLRSGAGQVTAVDFSYDGTTWFGSWDQTGSDSVLDPGDYDLLLDASEKNVDLFRRLGSPVIVATWEVAISPGVIIHTDTHGVPALDIGGAFPSGTIINILNQGYIVGRGGDGDGAQVAMDDDGSQQFCWALRSKHKDGSDAVIGPPTGTTVNFTNALGYIWGGGGGGGAGGAASNGSFDDAAGGAGGGGAGNGKGGSGFLGQTEVSAGSVLGEGGTDGRIKLDATNSGGAAGAAQTSGGFAGAGGAGGDFGSAGSAGTSAGGGSTSNVLAATAGGAAGRAVSSGYGGTITFVSGGTAPNVKGSL